MCSLYFSLWFPLHKSVFLELYCSPLCLEMTMRSAVRVNKNIKTWAVQIKQPALGDNSPQVSAQRATKWHIQAVFVLFFVAFWAQVSNRRSNNRTHVMRNDMTMLSKILNISSESIKSWYRRENDQSKRLPSVPLHRLDNIQPWHTVTCLTG